MARESPDRQPVFNAIPQTAASADCGRLAVRNACHSQSYASNGFGDLSPGKYGLCVVPLQRSHRNFFLSVRDHGHDLQKERRWDLPAFQLDYA
jgi:hypothetical protein